MKRTDFRETGTVRTVRAKSAFSGKVYHSERSLVHRFHKAKLPQLIRRVTSSLVFTSSRMYGFLLLIFGLGTLLSHLATYYIATEEIDVLYSLIVGGICSLLAVPLLLSGDPICLVTQKNPVTNFILYGFFFLRRHHPDGTAHPLPVWASVPIGIGLTVLGYFTAPSYVLAALVALTFFLLSFSAPEFPFLWSLLLLPYLSLIPGGSHLLALLVGVAALSYLRKVLLGNRLYRFERYDALIIPTILIVLILGALSDGGFLTALIFSVLFFAVPLSANLPSNRRIADSTLGAIAIGVFPAALYSLIDLAAGGGVEDAVPPLLSLSIRQATFPGLDVAPFSLLLLAAALISVNGLADRTKSPVSHLLYSVFLVTDLTALFFARATGFFLAFAVGLFVFFTLRGSKRPGLYLILLLTLPFVLLFLPTEWKSAAYEWLGVESAAVDFRLSASEAIRRLIPETLFFGHGFSSESAIGAGVSGYFALAFTVGLIPSLLLASVSFMRARHISIMLPAVSRRRNSARPVVALTSVLLAFFVAAFFTDVFAHPATFYLFWVIFGVGSATLALARGEWEALHDRNREENGSDSAYLDVEIR